MHLAKMQDFQGEGSDRLDLFFDHVEELADFYRWDGRETCRQARAHLKGTALAYVKRAPFQPSTWEELKALLLKRFQPRDLTATCNNVRDADATAKIFIPSLRLCSALQTWHGHLWMAKLRKS